jgi:hypothetical protein
MKTASWVICRKGSTVALFETFNPAIVAKLNTEKYVAVPILRYLQDLNRRIREGATS